MFHTLMTEVKESILEENACSFEVIQEEKETVCYLRYWRKNQFCRIAVGAYGRYFRFPLGENFTIANVLSCLGGTSPIVAVVGTNAPFALALGRARKNNRTQPVETERAIVNVNNFDFTALRDCLLDPVTHVLQQDDLLAAVEHVVIRLKSVARMTFIQNDTTLRIVSGFCTIVNTVLIAALFLICYAIFR